MEMNMATVEERKYEVSEEAEEIDESLTDRDTIMGNSATEFVKHEKEEPEKKLVVVTSHMCGLESDPWTETHSVLSMMPRRNV
jgi:hypothetical protein